MSLADRLKQRNLEREVAGKHPLIAMGLDRGTRDAYFRGIVLAAFLDDGKVDESERAYLRRVGLGLDLPDAEIAEMISSVGELRTENDQLALLEEISGLIGKSPVVAKLFLSEFSLVWRSHSANNAELETYRTEIARMIGVDIPDAFWRDFDAIFNDQADASETGRRLNGIGAEAMAYLFPKYVETSRGVIANGREGDGLDDRETPSGLPMAWKGILGAMREAFATVGTPAPKDNPVDDKYRLLLNSTGRNINTITDLITEISGLDRPAARSIAEKGNGCIATNLSYDEAKCLQRKLLLFGALVSVVKI